MKLYYYDIFLVLGISCVILAGFIFIVLVIPSRKNRGFSLIKKRNRDALIEDFNNPNIVFGGPLGIIQKLIKVGLFFGVLGIIVRLIYFVIT